MSYNIESISPITPKNGNRVIFYWDELHDKNNKEREGGRIITAVVEVNKNQIQYGATVFRKDTRQDKWSRENHRWTAEQRLSKRPVSFTLKIPKDELAQVAEEATKLADSLSAAEQATVQDLKRRVVESHVRDYLLKVLKKQVRSSIINQGTCGVRIK